VKTVLHECRKLTWSILPGPREHLKQAQQVKDIKKGVPSTSPCCSSEWWFKNLARTRGKLIIIAVSKKLTDPFKKIREFIDYRSSKLTRILQPSLQGNANIVMICNVTPFSADQTANTLL
jgi:Kinesin motor domain